MEIEKSCNPKIYWYGKHLGTIRGLETTKIEEIVKSASELSGQAIDWHYMGGRAVIKGLDNDLISARNALKEGLKGYEDHTYTLVPEDEIKSFRYFNKRG